MNELAIDRPSLRYVRTIEIMAAIGLAIMLVAGIAYFAGVARCVSPDEVIANWDKPASEFWMATRGVEAKGYSWFLGDLACSSNVSLVGVVLLLLAPLVALISVFPTNEGVHRILNVVLIVELLFAAVRSLFSS